MYDDSLYSADLIEKICCYYKTVMEQFVLHGDDPLRKISLLDEGEEKLLADFHTVKEESVIPDDTFFFTGMERKAAVNPDHIALIASDGTYTYKEFDSITDRVANALIKSLLAYDTDDGYGERILIKMNRKYTYQVLYRLGFSWSTLTEDYIRRFINALKGLGYFDFDAVI